MPTSTKPFALVVDDDAVIRADVCVILEEAGFRTHDAESGDEAKGLLHKVAESVTLLFSDVEMPGHTNGFALARYVAEHWPYIEIVVASGRMKPKAEDMPPKASFIGKPFSAEMVHDHLREKLPDGKKPSPLRVAV